MSPNDSATRPSSVSSLFHACLQHLHVLDHWVNKGQSLSFGESLKVLCDAIQLLHFFQPFSSFLRLNCYTRLNHECTQQDSIHLCKDQLCTQRFQLRYTITKDSHARNTCYLCKFKLNKKYLNALT
ncbi:hypothetical protein H5410_003561 [Solanum commersonii]|uniref:Uncharacterized protein n=1 Tax=Solanum commersonii TaxID=4109 RepID=A0A9J6B5H7_SOLCO|nr:hypothetical protein H5410_003561 [Solanum commersonii]